MKLAGWMDITWTSDREHLNLWTENCWTKEDLKWKTPFYSPLQGGLSVFIRVHSLAAARRKTVFFLNS
jgi:hypothetical protein